MADALYRHDDAIMPALAKLRDCLCNELDKSGLSADCDCVLIHGLGTNVAPPAPGKGFAWVGVTGAFASKDFPNPDVSRSVCATPLAASFVMGVVRCFQVNPRGESGEDMLRWLDKQMADMQAMRRAILCCGVEDVSLGTYTPIGPEGGAFGGSWTGTVGQVDD